MDRNEEFNLLKNFLPYHFKHEALATAVDKTINFARAKEIFISIAILDYQGRLAYFYRDPKAILISLDLAPKKAHTAYALLEDTYNLKDLTLPGQPLYQLETANSGQIVTFGGGVLIQSKQTLLGAVGVSGAKSPKDDDLIAKKLVEYLIN